MKKVNRVAKLFSSLYLGEMKKNARKLEDLDWKFNLDRRKPIYFSNFRAIISFMLDTVHRHCLCARCPLRFRTSSWIFSKRNIFLVQEVIQSPCTCTTQSDQGTDLAPQSSIQGHGQEGMQKWIQHGSSTPIEPQLEGQSLCLQPFLNSRTQQHLPLADDIHLHHL